MDIAKTITVVLKRRPAVQCCTYKWMAFGKLNNGGKNKNTALVVLMPLSRVLFVCLVLQKVKVVKYRWLGYWQWNQQGTVLALSTSHNISSPSTTVTACVFYSLLPLPHTHLNAVKSPPLQFCFIWSRHAFFTKAFCPPLALFFVLIIWIDFYYVFIDRFICFSLCHFFILF